MEIKNEVLPTEYVSLRNRSGMSKRYLEHAEKALKNSLFKIGIYEKNELIAFGRVAGDGYITFVVTDIMVDKDQRLMLQLRCRPRSSRPARPEPWRTPPPPDSPAPVPCPPGPRPPRPPRTGLSPPRPPSDSPTPP